MIGILPTNKARDGPALVSPVGTQWPVVSIHAIENMTVPDVSTTKDSRMQTSLLTISATSDHMPAIEHGIGACEAADDHHLARLEVVLAGDADLGGPVFLHGLGHAGGEPGAVVGGELGDGPLVHGRPGADHAADHISLLGGQHHWVAVGVQHWPELRCDGVSHGDQ